MKNKKKSDFSLLFDNEKVISQHELNSSRGGSICANLPIMAGQTPLGWAYIGIG